MCAASQPMSPERECRVAANACGSYDCPVERLLAVTCSLLHMIEAPDRNAYTDPDVKDLIGQMPQLFCAYCSPPKPLAPSESARCLERDAPCWKPAADICKSA